MKISERFFESFAANWFSALCLVLAFLLIVPFRQYFHGTVLIVSGLMLYRKA